MRHGRHSEERFLEEHPEDQRALLAVEMVQNLAARPWPSMPHEEPIEHRRRVEQSFHAVEREILGDAAIKLEKDIEKQAWIDAKLQAIEENWHGPNTATRDQVLRSGGGASAKMEKDGLVLRLQREGHPELNAHMQDVIDKQTARERFIVDHVIAPALDQKLEELGLDKVQEPEKAPHQEPIKEPGKGSQILEDVMDRSPGKEEGAFTMEQARKALAEMKGREEMAPRKKKNMEMDF